MCFKSIGFEIGLQATSLKPECAGLDLSALMIMPIQRVPRYSMLLKEMIKVRRGSVEPQLTEASSLIDDALVVINEKKREAERMQQVGLYSWLDDDIDRSIDTQLPMECSNEAIAIEGTAADETFDCRSKTATMLTTFF